MNDVPTGVPSEPVPNRLRILAAQENLGNLISVHRPAGFPAGLVFRGHRIYLYDRGLVLSGARGLLLTFLWEQLTVTEVGGSRLLSRPDGTRFRLTRHWTEHQELWRRLPSR